jgi:hypothetical protein
MNILQRIERGVALTIGKVHWRGKHLLDAKQIDEVTARLAKDHYILLSHRSNHLSTFFIGLASFLLTGKWAYWCHALMNLENEVVAEADFRFIEAVGTGVKFTGVNGVLDVQGLVLLRPKNMTIDRWTTVLDKARTELGKPYDTLFDLSNDQALSCVELVRSALQSEPTYWQDFAHFEEMIASKKNLTPEMFYNCPDFCVEYEVRNK